MWADDATQFPAACGSHHIYLALDADADVMHVVAVLHQRMEPRRHILKALKGSEDHGPD